MFNDVLNEKYAGKIIERIDNSHDTTVEIFFTDGSVMTIVAYGTEEQWIDIIVIQDYEE